jgi:hypothetical protein
MLGVVTSKAVHIVTRVSTVAQVILSKYVILSRDIVEIALTPLLLNKAIEIIPLLNLQM